MKTLKQITNIVFLLCCTFTFAQAPQLMSYQSVVRNASGVLSSNSNINIRISILQNSASGTAVYVETHATATNENGLATLQIGAGNVQYGNFNAINWGNGTYFIKTETDPNGGGSYSISGTSQLLSVPYALYATNTKSLGKTTIYLTGDITDAEAVARVTNEAGPNTENIYILNTTVLTSLDLSSIGITTLMNLRIENNTALQSVILNDVTQIYDTFQVSTNPALTSLSFATYTNINSLVFKITTCPQLNLEFPNLSKINSENFSIYDCTVNFPALTTITGEICTFAVKSLNMPALTAVSVIDISRTENLNLSSLSTGTINFSSISLANLNLPNLSNSSLKITNSSMTSITFPNLVSGSLNVSNNSQLTTIFLPNLVSGAFNISNNLQLTTISLPNLTTFTGGTSSIMSNKNLRSISFPNLNFIDNSTVAYPNLTLSNNSFPSTTINEILSKLLTVSPVYGVNLANQQPVAAPTGQGLIDKQTLISQGKNIYTN